jgi:hypothetical protein
MAPLNFKENQSPTPEKDYQVWIIEDSWDGAVYLEARLVKTWQGLCGSHRLLEDRQGQWYWWAVFPAPEGRGALQKVVNFPDWESLAAELGLPEIIEPPSETGVGLYH